MKVKNILAIFLCLSAISVFCGCDPTATQDQQNNESQDDHGHSHDDHGHSHDDGGHGDQANGDGLKTHVHGPRGGEVYDFGDFRCEVVMPKSKDKIVIHLMKKDSDDEHRVKADKLVAKQTQGREDQVFDIPAVNADDEGMASEFTLADDALNNIYNRLGFELSLDLDGNTIKQDVPKNPH